MSRYADDVHEFTDEQVRTAVRGWKEQARRCGARGAEIAATDTVIDAER